MSIRVAINGFGRIGRTVFRAILDRGEPVEVVALNDLGSAAELAYLLQYDSVHGTYPKPVTSEGDSILVAGKPYKVLKVADPAQAPWKDLKVDVVLETSGRFTKGEDCRKHLAAGARKVVLSAPGKGMDATFCMGVNHEAYDPRNHHAVSNASCTTNCLAPVVKVLHENFRIEHGLMTTVHSYTMDQRLLDALHTDKRRSRAAAMSMVPTTTGAASAVGEVIPELKGKLDGLAVRVPTPNVSLVDFVARVSRDVTKAEVNKALEDAANGALKGVMNYVTEELVSIDFNHCPASSSIDSSLTRVMDGRMVKVLSWYDNEYGYSNRVVDLALYVARQL